MDSPWLKAFQPKLDRVKLDTPSLGHNCPRGPELATPWITGQNAVPLGSYPKNRRKDLAQFFVPNSSTLDILISQKDMRNGTGVFEFNTLPLEV